jgi:hypothetical protein
MSADRSGSRRLSCACRNPGCTVALEIETFPHQDTVVLRVGEGGEYPFPLSELMQVLQEYTAHGQGPGR